jgi:hypothetical protein
VPRKTYDDVAFNAEEESRNKPWSDAEFFAHFESTRQKTESSLKSMPETAFFIR